jgi:putative ABC transport system permease protein
VQTTGGVGKVDLLVLLFPVLFVAAAAGLATRALGTLLPTLRRAGERGSAAVYLASRRLAGATRTAMLLVTASAVAVGVLVYAGSLVSSVRGSLAAKAQVLNGSDVRVVLPEGAALPSRWPFPATVVEHVPRATLIPTRDAVELVAIDPATFWDAVSSRAIVGAPAPSELAASLAARAGQRVPVLAAGAHVPAGATLDVGPLRFPVIGVGEATAFPGMAAGLPLVVVDRSALDRAIATGGTTLAGVAGDVELWARAPAGTVVAALRGAGVRPGPVSTVGEVLDRPEFHAVTWTFGLLEALGVLAGLVAAVAVILFLQARQQARDVSYALASRMGLRRSAHRRSVLAEIAGMLAVAFALGVGLGMAGAAAVVGRIDLLPGVPPGPSVVVPGAVVGLAAASLAVVVVAGAWLVQVQADRARVAEVMRRAAA